MRYALIKKRHILPFVLIFLCFYSLFFTSYAEVDGKSMSSFIAFLKYNTQNIGFLYFPIIFSLLLIGLILHTITLNEKYSKYAFYVNLIWIITIVANLRLAVSLENYLEPSELGNADAIPVLVIFFLLAIMTLPNLISFVIQTITKVYQRNKRLI